MAQHYFTKQLLQWHRKSNLRELPWKGITDPYKIWLSEIMLQQTQAITVIPYYTKFIKTFSTVKKLAAADDEYVLKMWQGLGYYSRCRNMLKAARVIVAQHKGIFPNSYAQIRALPGIGGYTAAAISSFAFQLPHAVVDGNVLRIITRYFNISDPVDDHATRNKITMLAQQLLGKNNPAEFNQAIMDFGATICTPKKAQCTICPLQKKCEAFTQNLVDNLPIKQKKIQVTTRYFYYYLIDTGKGIYLQQRTQKDVWQFMYELPMQEFTELKEITNKPIYQSKQRLTHQLIHAYFFQVAVTQVSKTLLKNARLVPYKQITQYSLPKTINDALKVLGYLK